MGLSASEGNALKAREYIEPSCGLRSQRYVVKSRYPYVQMQGIHSNETWLRFKVQGHELQRMWEEPVFSPRVITSDLVGNPPPHTHTHKQTHT
jgi:hypothetical protein